jgi:hypothetical protein
MLVSHHCFAPCLAIWADAQEFLSGCLDVNAAGFPLGKACQQVMMLDTAICHLGCEPVVSPTKMVDLDEALLDVTVEITTSGQYLGRDMQLGMLLPKVGVAHPRRIDVPLTHAGIPFSTPASLPHGRQR